MKSIATEIGARLDQVEAAVSLLDGGATVPFIARYRKEATGGLDDEQLRKLEVLLKQYRALVARRDAVLKALTGMKVLTPGLRKAVMEAQTRTALEAVYAPFKSTRKSKADEAREKGFDKVAQALKAGKPMPKVKDKEEAFSGACDIVVDEMMRDPVRIDRVVNVVREKPLVVRAVRGKTDDAKKWLEDARPETATSMPSHRALGLMRAMKEGVVAFEVAPEPGELVRGLGTGRDFLSKVGEYAWSGRVGNAVKSRVLEELKIRASAEAIEVFRKNLRDLLLAPPAGHKAVLGLDPGLRTGIKAAVIDKTGKVMDTGVINLLRDPGSASRVFQQLSKGVALIALGNGTGSREAQAWLTKIGNKIPVVVVSEAGASVYSASKLASDELPGMDVSLRGAVSIARRLQDPLSELVKIDPKALGVGQYQHDIDPGLLMDALSGVVEDCVASVGVDVNTASPALLAYVPGIGPALAEKIVAHRDANGAFASRAALKKVSGLGAKAFEQATGFLRVYGSNPLDATAIHPESYKLAKALADMARLSVADALGSAAMTKVDWRALGEGPSIHDVYEEMCKPGRDPRPQFRTARFDEAVSTPDDLRVGMRLEGVVSNVAAFGAFVDVGVHQDGLVHVSEMSEEFVSDPSKVVKVGEVVRVRVVSISEDKKRIGLSMKPERSGMPRKAAPAPTKGGAGSDSPFAALSKLR